MYFFLFLNRDPDIIANFCNAQHIFLYTIMLALVYELNLYWYYIFVLSIHNMVTAYFLLL